MDKVDRLWGHFTVLFERPDKTLKVKRLVFEPRLATSLQSHKFRTEQFLVEEGTVTLYALDGEKVFHKNETFKIEPHQIHMLINKTDNLLCLIEIQYGSYTDDSDKIEYGKIETKTPS